MAKKPKRSSAKTRKGKKQGTAADPYAAPAPGAKRFTKVTVTVGKDGMVSIPGADMIPDKPLPSVKETVDGLLTELEGVEYSPGRVVAASKRAKAARAGAHPPIPTAAGGPETAPGSAKLPTGEEKPAKMGRPTTYTQELADDLIEHMAGGRSVASWCAKDGHPHVATVLRWTAAHPDFREAYARAREFHADAIFDEIVDIADDKTGDWIETDKGMRYNPEAAARSRVRVEARLKVAGRLNPQRYSERVGLEIDDKRPATSEERLARINQLLALGVPKLPAPASE
jgi:hypothetical protein